MNNKVVAKELIRRAEELSALSPEQYGCRKHKSAAVQSLKKRIIFDVTRQTRVPMIMIGNDSKSAYDRIVHAPAILALRRLGLPAEVCTAMFSPIQSFQHHIRTMYGDSDVPFSAEDKIFHGVGQGNGAGPMVWTVLSSVVIDTFRSLHRSGLAFPIPFSYSVPDLVGLAYVDDVDLFASGREGQSLLDLIREAQQRLTDYESIVRITSGAINPNKSYV